MTISSRHCNKSRIVILSEELAFGEAKRAEELGFGPTDKAIWGSYKPSEVGRACSGARSPFLSVVPDFVPEALVNRMPERRRYAVQESTTLCNLAAGLKPKEKV